MLVGTRFASKDGYEAYKALTDIVPRPDYVATGEERAWGRRLAKRFGIENGQYDERNFVVKGDGDGYPLALGMMAAVCLGLYILFRRRDWL